MCISGCSINRFNDQKTIIGHSALKLEKSAISKVQKHLICIFKNGKKSIFAPEKKSENGIFGSFKLFSGAKIDFLPFLK